MTISRLNCSNSLYSFRSRGRMIPRAGILGIENSFLKQDTSYIPFIKKLVPNETLFLGYVWGTNHESQVLTHNSKKDASLNSKPKD